MSALPRDPTLVTDPLLRADLRPRVQQVLDDWFAQTRAALLAVDPDCVTLADAVGDLVREGKRLRAGFCYWGWRGAGADDDDAIVRAAAAVELVQASALLHDDLIDDSDTRRGLPAAHRRLQAEHHQRRWTGDSVHFGKAAAVLAGDLCLAASAQVLHAAVAGLPQGRRESGLAVYDEMTAQLMAGQYLDVLVGARPHGADDVEQARRVITYKTVNYTVARPLALGGCLAGADSSLLDSYRAYARSVGEAFQLRDDLLGVFGDPTETGKPAGDDLREGKQTVLVALARQQANAEQSVELARVGDPALSDADIATLRQVLIDTGAVGEVEALIKQLAGEGHEVVRTTELPDEAAQVLDDLVTASTRRAR